MKTFLNTQKAETAIFVLAFLFLLLLVTATISAIGQERLTGKVVDVIDGDTYWVNTVEKGSIKVRLQNADTYETARREGLYRQAYQSKITLDSALVLGKKGKAYATKALLGKEVELVEEPKDKGKDSHGTRDLYLVKINGQDFGVMLEEAGLAAPWTFKKYRFQHDSTSR